MDLQNLRTQVLIVQRSLQKNEVEHRYLLDLLGTYEKLLALHNEPSAGAAVLIRSPETGKAEAEVATPKAGSPSSGQAGVGVSEALLRVLQESDGEPVSNADLIQLIELFGARTQSATPENTINTLVRRLRDKGLPIESVSKGVWRWVGDVASRDRAQAEPVTEYPEPIPHEATRFDQPSSSAETERQNEEERTLWQPN